MMFNCIEQPKQLNESQLQKVDKPRSRLGPDRDSVCSRSGIRQFAHNTSVTLNAT